MAKMGWRNVKIGSKYGIALAITIIMFVTAAGFVTMSMQHIEDAVEAIEMTADRMITLTHMVSLFRTKELIILDYTNLERQSLIQDYKKVEEEFTELYNQLEANMDTEELQFLSGLILRNNTQLDQIFQNVIIPELKEGNMEEVNGGIARIGGLRAPTAQLFERVRDEVNIERHNAMKAAYKNIEDSKNVLRISIVSAVILGSLIVFLISRSISGNLKKVVGMTNKISEGELTVEEVKYLGSDEVGQLSSAMNRMLNNLRNMMKEISEASGKVEEESSDLKRIAEEVQQSSEQIAATMQEMSAGAEEQASSASEIANSIFNLTELVKKANGNKEALEHSTQGILDVVQKGNTQMEDSIGSMNMINEILKDAVVKVKKLDDNSKKVSILVQIINSIAEQTNLLALNAAIEAARAGDAGRGFAVVADEIRKLAEQVGKSVNEITDIVGGIQNESKSMTDSLEKGYHRVEEGTHKIKATGEIFEKVNSEIDSMIEKIKNVSLNLEEIAAHSNKINTAGEQIAAISQENSAGIEQTVASVEEQNSSMEIINQNANSLANSADILKNLVKQFKI